MTEYKGLAAQHEVREKVQQLQEEFSSIKNFVKEIKEKEKSILKQENIKNVCPN